MWLIAKKELKDCEEILKSENNHPLVAFCISTGLRPQVALHWPRPAISAIFAAETANQEAKRKIYLFFICE